MRRRQPGGGSAYGAGAAKPPTTPQSIPIPDDAWVRIYLAHPVHGGTQVEIVAELVELAETGHHEAGHGNRVARLAEAIATSLEPDLATRAFRAGLLHDIGKALLPFHPATMPRRLSRTERNLVDRHPTLGADLAHWAGEPAAIVTAVRGHHERLDGSGYPYGLRGAAVPLLAQIVAAADVIEALQSRRSYKPAWSLTAINAYFRAHRRGWLIPQVWKAAIEQTGALDSSPADVEAGLLEQP